VDALLESSTLIDDGIFVHEDDSSEFDAFHLLVAHDEISKQIAICNDDYKFVTYPHSILQKFAVDGEVIVTIHFEGFSTGTVRKLHARRTGSYRVLRMITSIIHELDIP